MAEKKNAQDRNSDEQVVAQARDFWTRYNKPIMIVSVLLIVVIGGWYAYKNFFKNPKEAKAADAMFKAEEYYRMDSLDLALNGDGQFDGFLRIIDKYGGTDAGNLARFYAGDIYVQKGDNANAVKHLEKFSTSSKPIQARAYKLLGDAYADQGKNSEALSNYKKAARHFEEDEANSAEYLFYAAYFADRVMKNKNEAIELYKELKEKFPQSPQSMDATSYLAQLGVYSVE
jgi:predicted negative regulator of RcsB-dependent stress response